MTDKSWMARRVAMALALMVSFYVLALSIAFGLLGIAYADVVYTSARVWKLIAFCVAGAGSILWAILPRPDRFEPPGPRLTRDEEPDLFTAIDATAAATGQAPPAEVYMTNDINAFVSQRGGIMGLGSRRVMGVGLPLMQALTVDEFTAVLAHEFGHYHAGDVALGPWIHKTRAAIVRTIVRLHENVLQKIFIAYGNLFLRITHAVSRRQEFIADEVAARAAGATAMVSGLRKVVAASFAYQTYWQGELQPVIAAGFVPPVTAGFARYMQNHHLSAFMTALVEAHESEGQTDPYDTHPSLKDRVAALSSLPAGSTSDDRPATALLRSVSASERRVLSALSADLANLRPIEWSRVGEMVYVPIWRARLKAHGMALPECAIGNFPATKETLTSIGRATFTRDQAPVDEQCDARAWQLLVAGIGVAIVPLGWTPDRSPGDETIFRRDGHELRAYSELTALVEGTSSPEQWRERCRALGLCDVPLAREATPNSSSNQANAVL